MSYREGEEEEEERGSKIQAHPRKQFDEGTFGNDR